MKKVENPFEPPFVVNETKTRIGNTTYHIVDRTGGNSFWVDDKAQAEFIKAALNYYSYSENIDSINWLKSLADKHADGHFTICKFTTGYRVGLGTPSCREDMDALIEGTSVWDATTNLFKKLKRDARV